MALSGTFTGTASNAAIVPKIVWSGVQSHDENYTDVTATLYYSRTDSYRTSGTWAGTINIDGNTTSESKSITITFNSNTMAISATARIPHDDDGTKTITISATGAISGSTLSSTTISQTIELDTIPIPSTVSVSNAIIGSPAIISISSASANFTHTLRYSFGTIREKPIADKTNSTNIAWKVPDSFYNEIPDAPTGWGVITCVTYNDGNKVGETVCEFTAVADKTICAPQIKSVTAYDAETKTVDLTGNKNVLIYGASSLRVQTTANAVNGASIKSIDAYCGSIKLTGSDVTFKSPIGPYSTEVYVIATDTRGFTARYDVTTLSLVHYQEPNMIREISRESPTSDKVTVKVYGGWSDINFGKADNQLSISVRYKEEGSAQYNNAVAMPITVTVSGTNAHFDSTLTFSGLDYTKAYRFELTLTDKIFTNGGVRPAKVVSDIPLSKGIPVFDWGEDDFRFNVPVTFAAGYIDPTSVASVEPADFILEQGTSGMWTYRKWSSGISEAWGENSLTIATQTAYGNGFYNGSVINHALPSGLFNARPMVVASVSNTGDAQLYYPVIAVTRAGEINYSIMSTKSNASSTVYVSFRLTGRWK